MNRPTAFAHTALAQSNPATCASQDSLCQRMFTADQQVGMKDPDIVGRTVAKVRDAQDISQYELAEQMRLAGFEMSRGHIMNWERGRADITICELAEVARICRAHRIEFVPKPVATADAGHRKRGLSCKVIVTVEFHDDPNEQPDNKKKTAHRVQKRCRKS